jgi:hypothetical protein
MRSFAINTRPPLRHPERSRCCDATARSGGHAGASHRSLLNSSAATRAARALNWRAVLVESVTRMTVRRARWKWWPARSTANAPPKADAQSACHACRLRVPASVIRRKPSRVG